jgi:hypothetical protein
VPRLRIAAIGRVVAGIAVLLAEPIIVAAIFARPIPLVVPLVRAPPPLSLA